MQTQIKKSINIILLGSGASGKTSIINLFRYKKIIQNIPSTIGVDYFKQPIKNKQKIQAFALLWDTASQQRYKAINKVHLKKKDGFIIVYDLTDESTYYNIATELTMIEQIKAQQGQQLREGDIIIIGNKLDLIKQRKISTERAIKDYEEKKGIKCYQVSCLLDNQVCQIIDNFMTDLYYRKIRKQYSQEQVQFETIIESIRNDISKIKNKGNIIRNLDIIEQRIKKQSSLRSMLQNCQEQNERIKKKNNILKDKYSILQREYDKEVKKQKTQTQTQTKANSIVKQKALTNVQNLCISDIDQHSNHYDSKVMEFDIQAGSSFTSNLQNQSKYQDLIRTKSQIIEDDYNFKQFIEIEKENTETFSQQQLFSEIKQKQIQLHLSNTNFDFRLQQIEDQIEDNEEESDEIQSIKKQQKWLQICQEMYGENILN